MSNSAQDKLGKLVVLSDLHLWGPHDPLYRAFLNFLETRLQRNDKLFIVGDLFDLFIGNKTIFADRFSELVRSFQRLGNRCIEVFYLEGNHDFHLESLFDDHPHVHLFSDTFHYEWANRQFHFCHGDKINWRDIHYQFFRFATRNLVSQCLIDVIPGTLIDRVGRFMSQTSRGYHGEPSSKVISLFRNYACEQISSGYDFVVMGHSHHLDNIRFRVEGHEGQYVNVGYPRKHRKYFELKSDETFFRLKSWDDLVIPIRPDLSILER